MKATDIATSKEFRMRLVNAAMDKVPDYVTFTHRGEVTVSKISDTAAVGSFDLGTVLCLGEDSMDEIQSKDVSGNFKVSFESAEEIAADAALEAIVNSFPTVDEPR